MKITCIGAGYVGLVTGVCFSKLGFKVTLIDIDKKKVDLINNKNAPIYEKDLECLLKEVNLKATTDYSEIKDSDVVFICVGTPAKSNGAQDLSHIKKVIKQISKYIKNKVIVIKSSVVPQTTEKTIIPLLEKESNLSEGKDFFVAVNPEFLREGTAIYDFKNPDRIVIGYSHKKSKECLSDLYSSFLCPKIYTSRTAAEMIKYASNSFLATKISFINEIGNICKKIGIDTYEVADGMGYDKRIGRAFLNSGPGWGGSCFPKDIKALIKKAKEINENALILKSVVKVNDKQPLKLVKLLKKHINDLKGKQIGILGAAFKANTDDVRESRTIPVVKELLKQKAKIKLYDPKAMDNFKKIFPEISFCKIEEVLNSDAILILTDWEQFNNLDYKGKIVIDSRNIKKAREAKVYEGICW